VFASRPLPPTPRLGAVPAGSDRPLWLVRAVHRSFDSTASLLDDPVLRDEMVTYVDDLARPYGYPVRPDRFGGPTSPAAGQSYGEMAATLIDSLIGPDEPVDLLVMAFSVHDLLPGRAAATYLSHVCPGSPLSFAICDQGTAAAFSGLHIINQYAASGLCRRALLIVVEQAVLPYDTPARVPRDSHGVAMLYEVGDARETDGPATARSEPPRSVLARVVAVRQRAGVSLDTVHQLAATGVAELSGGDVHTVLSDALAQAWADHPPRLVSVASPDRPATGVWSTVVDELHRHRRVVAADYDQDLGYLSLLALMPG
jgi:4-hydroxymandelate oxidase